MSKKQTSIFLSRFLFALNITTHNKGNKVKTFISFLKEELTDSQKSEVDEWAKSSKAQSISSHVFEKDQHRLIIPIEDSHDASVRTPGVVAHHLLQHGYKVHDYAKGLAIEPKYGRQISIGKVLQKTDPGGPIQQFYNNDPARTASRLHKTQVVISRHPYDVAGMSTDRGWTSCMDMSSGMNRHYLEHDIKQGTHVAYLTHAGDDDIKNPIARIALKPWHLRDENGRIKHTVLAPEQSTYGSGTGSFEHTVNSWAHTHFPPLPGETGNYKKNTRVYDDDGADWVHGDNISDKIRSHIESGSRDPDKEEELMLEFLHHRHSKALINVPHIHKFVYDHAYNYNGNVNEHSAFSTNVRVVNHLIQSRHSDHQDLISKYEPGSFMHEYATLKVGQPEQYKKIINDPDITDLTAHLYNLAQNPHMDHETALDFVNHHLKNINLDTSEESDNVYDNIVSKISSDDMHKILDTKLNVPLARAIARHGTKEHLDKIMKLGLHQFVSVADAVADRGFADHSQALFNDAFTSTKLKVIKKSNNREFLSNIVKTHRDSVITSAALHRGRRFKGFTDEIADAYSPFKYETNTIQHLARHLPLRHAEFVDKAQFNRTTVRPDYEMIDSVVEHSNDAELLKKIYHHEDTKNSTRQQIAEKIPDYDFHRQALMKGYPASVRGILKHNLLPHIGKDVPYVGSAFSHQLALQSIPGINEAESIWKHFKNHSDARTRARVAIAISATFHRHELDFKADVGKIKSIANEMSHDPESQIRLHSAIYVSEDRAREMVSDPNEESHIKAQAVKGNIRSDELNKMALKAKEPLVRQAAHHNLILTASNAKNFNKHIAKAFADPDASVGLHIFEKHQYSGRLHPETIDRAPWHIRAAAADNQLGYALNVIKGNKEQHPRVLTTAIISTRALPGNSEHIAKFANHPDERVRAATLYAKVLDDDKNIDMYEHDPSQFVRHLHTFAKYSLNPDNYNRGAPKFADLHPVAHNYLSRSTKDDITQGNSYNFEGKIKGPSLIQYPNQKEHLDPL